MHPSRTDASLNRLCREYVALRNFNEERGHDSTALMAAEGLTGLVCLERFLRVVLRDQATETDTIANLLEKATSAGINLLDPPIQFAFLPSGPGDRRTTNDRNRAFSVDVVTSLRNALLHGNYEQAADGTSAEASSYLDSDSYRVDLAQIFHFVASLLVQFDENGNRREPTDRTREDQESALRDARERLARAIDITARRAAARR